MCFSKKSVEILKKVWKKFGNPAKSATFAVPFGKGGLGASSADRGKFIESEEGSPSGAGKSGPLRPVQTVIRPVQGKKTKVVLYNEEFDPGSG